MLLPFSLASMTLYQFDTWYNSFNEQSSNTFFFETAIGDFRGGYFMNKMNDCLMICSYTCGELFLHTDKNHIIFLLLEANKCRKTFAF